MPPRKRNEQGEEILTLREERFVEFVAQGKSLTDAALEAGYSEKTARAIGQENLTKPVLQQALQQRIQGLKAETDEIHRLLALHLRGDMGDLVDCLDDDGDFSLSRAKRLGLSRLIKKFKPRTTRRVDKDGSETIEKTVDIELYSAQEAAKVLADIHGLKQAPKTNEADVLRERAKGLFEQALARLGSEEAAKEWIAGYPELSQYVN